MYADTLKACPRVDSLVLPKEWFGVFPLDGYYCLNSKFHTLSPDRQSVFIGAARWMPRSFVVRTKKN